MPQVRLEHDALGCHFLLVQCSPFIIYLNIAQNDLVHLELLRSYCDSFFSTDFTIISIIPL